MNRSILLLVALVLAAISQTSLAGLIVYSLNGTIEPLDPNEDPWGVGAAGKPYFISVSVDESEVDVDTEIDGAFFEATSFLFSIDGASPTSLGSGQIWFRELASRDSVSILLKEIEFNGVREEFFPAAGLPTSTFTLTTPSEPPPLFPPTTTITRGGSSGDGSSYISFTGPGVTVTATLIPEPSTMVLALLAAFGVGITRWRKRIR